MKFKNLQETTSSVLNNNRINKITNNNVKVGKYPIQKKLELKEPATSSIYLGKKENNYS